MVYDNPLFREHCILYIRYIDDLLVLWDGTMDSLVEFHTFLNGMEETLKSTNTSDRVTINFLDVQLTRVGTGLKTDLFRKTTDKNSVLHYTSFHPKPLRDSLPLSQYTRLKRIVSNDSDLQKEKGEMTSRFMERGYPHDILDMNKRKLQNRSREDLLCPLKRYTQKSDRLMFVSKYTTASRHVGNIIRRHWHILQSCHQDIPSFQQPPMLAYKRGRNLKDQLVKADIGGKCPSKQLFLQNPKFGTFPCLHCTQCNSVTKGNIFYHPHRGNKYEIKKYFTCESSFVRDRISKHKSTIRRGLTALPVPAHFQSARHSISQLKFQVIDSVEAPRRGGNRLLMLKKLEMMWIHKLDTIWPRGLNREYTPANFIF
ncbi:hypothetical protein XELAEV_18026834mg [Xenopus laevis]|uniref:Helix-turn-helix domain-containing protein n=1 Tax=Xenopus laevis TaxID=8355 RepID=A0A974CUH1_XENLA|nr:hypothetical protein XELAEV_18026834mg [Xenopus laevis]